ncbi:hypothetical protein BOX15_Mlig013424g2, partial [Macrostomum lignano]
LLSQPMHWLVVFVQVSLFALLIGPSTSSFSADQDHYCRDQVTDCVECDTQQDSRCADPFDTDLLTSGALQSVRCNGVCSKLVQRSPDSTRVRRTCSQNLRLQKLSPYLVCIDESSGNGQLCFCEEKNCNFAPPATGEAAGGLVLLMIAVGRATAMLCC